MSRYFVSHQHVTLTCSQLVVNMTTNTSQHLWLLWTTIPPYIRPRPFRSQQSTRPHQNNFSLEIQGDVEQEEPGNTAQHTFILPWNYQSTRIFFYSINMGTGKIKATRSPIFAYDITPRILLQETWFVPGQPDLNWQHSGTPPRPFPENGGGSVQLYNSVDRADSLTLDVTQYLGTDPTQTCNLFVRVNLKGFSAIDPTTELQGEVALIYENATGQQAARNGFFTTVQDPCTYNPTNYVYPASPNATIGFPVDPMLMTLPNICGEPNDPPIPNAYLKEIRLIAAQAGPLDPQREWTFRYGPVQIGTTTGQLTDVSGQWTGKRIAPFIP